VRDTILLNAVVEDIANREGRVSLGVSFVLILVEIGGCSTPIVVQPQGNTYRLWELQSEYYNLQSPLK
jgi:hypothetical protein